MTTIREMRSLVKNIDSKLLATDPRFQNSVLLVHRDGTTIFYRSAFLLGCDGHVVCFTEHHGWHVYHVDELRRYAMFGPELVIPEVKS